MKRQFKYYFLGLFCILLNSVAMQANTFIKTSNKKADFTYISQEQANRNAVNFLYYIYSTTPRELLNTGDLTPSHDKTYIRIISFHHLLKNRISHDTKINTGFNSNLHPDPIGYYIYTLGKIII